MPCLQEEGYQSDQGVGAMTALKQQEVGTPEMVKQTRRRYEDRTKMQLSEWTRNFSVCVCVSATIGAIKRLWGTVWGSSGQICRILLLIL